MAEIVKTIVLSQRAQIVANQMKDNGTFPDALSAAKFGMSYAIKYYWEDINTSDKVEKLNSIYDSKGTTYNIGSLDPDNYIEKLISALYPGTNSVYPFVRAIMCYGLHKLGDLLDEGKLFPINKIM